MKRAALLLLPLLAACTAPPRTEAPPSPFLGGIFRQPAAEAPAPVSLPPQVLAALPPGVPPSVVTRNADGCYLVTLERMEPPGGYPLRDAAGNRVCDGSVPVPGTTAGIAPVVLPPPAAVTTTSLEEAGLSGSLGGPSGPPVPTAVLGAPPPPGQEPAAPTGSAPLAPGDITPPAPLAPLDPA